MRRIIFGLLTLPLLLLSACAPVAAPDNTTEPSAAVSDIQENTGSDAWNIRVVDTAGAEIRSFTQTELAKQLDTFTNIYSTINNWPSTRFYAAQGYSVHDILTAAGVADAARTVTFRAADGFEVSLTRDQLMSPQYFYPDVGEDDCGAKPVIPVIAFRWREGTDDLNSLRDDKPCLIIGQRNTFEHTNPAFVIGVSEIVVDYSPCEAWPPASVFPLPGPIAAGETVKLQHPDFGLVKLYYTLDGSEPTTLSAMYNPSTYQTELNRPIPITGPTVIKVLASGYGKEDSEIAAFEFTPVP